MKKTLLCSVLMALMLGTSQQIWAEDPEGPAPTQTTSTATQNSGLGQLQDNKDVLNVQQPITGTSIGNEQAASTSVIPQTANTTQTVTASQAVSSLPSILGGLGLVLGLLSLIYAWRAVGKMTLSQNQLEAKLKALQQSEKNLLAQIAELFKNFQSYQQQTTHVIDELRNEIRTLKQTSLGGSHTESLTTEPKYLLDGELVVTPSDLGSVAANPVVEIGDQEKVDSLSDYLKTIFNQTGNKLTPDAFRAAFDKTRSDLDIAQLRLLQNDLKTELSRTFDAVVISLAEPLASGVNTLVYLQNHVAQHSSISLMFENARDGMVISEMIEPAQLNQSHGGELQLLEENIIQKGKVAEG